MQRTRHAQGFSIIEALVAVSILGIALLAIAPAFTDNLRINGRSEVRSQAAVAAQHVLEGLRLYDPASAAYPPAGTHEVTVGERTFQVTTSYCTTPAYCGAASKHIRAEVRFNGATVFNAETIYTQLALETH